MLTTGFKISVLVNFVIHASILFISESHIRLYLEIFLGTFNLALLIYFYMERNYQPRNVTYQLLILALSSFIIFFYSR